MSMRHAAYGFGSPSPITSFAARPRVCGLTTLSKSSSDSKSGFAARTPEKTAELYHKLRAENVIVSLREGNIHVSPHLYNTERDIDRLISVVTA